MHFVDQTKEYIDLNIAAAIAGTTQALNNIATNQWLCQYGFGYKSVLQRLQMAAVKLQE